MPNLKTLQYLVLTGFLLFLTVGSIKTILEILGNSHRLSELEDEVRMLENKQQSLNAQLEYYSSDEYIEKEARNSLNLVKPGEQIYISPVNLEKPVQQSSAKKILVREENGKFRLYFKDWFDIITRI